MGFVLTMFAYGQTKGKMLNEDSRYVAPDTTYVFFNHPSSMYDEKALTKKSTRKLKKSTSKKNIPSILASTPHDDNDPVEETYFVKRGETDYTLISYGGAHNLVFPNLKNIIFAGGYIELCLCEAIRDVARGTVFTDRHVKFILMTDAVFADATPYPEDKYFKAGTKSLSQSSTQPFSKILDLMSDTQLTIFLQEKVFDYDLERFCTNQHSNNLHTKGDISVSDFSVAIFRNGKKIKTLGTGSKKIDFELVSLKDFKKNFPNKMAINHSEIEKYETSTKTKKESSTISKQ